MTTDIQVFDVIGTRWRWGTDPDGTPWAVLSDVAKGFDHRDARDAARMLDEDEKGTRPVRTPGGTQQMLVVFEDGLWELIFRSSKPEAKAIKKRVKEILRGLRTGEITLAPVHPQLPTSFAEALELAAKQARELEAAAPMVEQAKQHRAADSLTSVPDFANKLKAWALQTHGVDVKHREVWDFLGEIRFLIRGETIRHNHPTAEATRRDFVRAKETTVVRNSGRSTNEVSPRLTPAGEGRAWDKAVARIAETGALARKQVAA